MHMKENTRLGRGLITFGAALTLLGASACVTPQQHDEAMAQVKAYQMRVHDLEAVNNDLENRLEALREELALKEVGAMEAGFDEDLMSRLNEYEELLNGLEGPLDDVQRFDLDGGYMFMVQNAVLFDLGSADISQEGRSALMTVAAEIRATPHGRVWVRGHTDNVPIKKPATKQKFPRGNLQLSAERAVEVAALLTSSGQLSPQKVAIIGLGAHEPIRPNDSPENRRLNRRVEIFVVDPAAGK